jgi:hypothetical protein
VHNNKTLKPSRPPFPRRLPPATRFEMDTNRRREIELGYEVREG